MASTANKKTLLVLEDGEKVSRAIKPALITAGWEVITYKDVTGILIMARQIEADVMLVDAQIRGAGVFSALTSFARNVNTAGIPIIAVTGRNGPQAKELMEAGVRGTVAEPLDPAEVVKLAEDTSLDSLDFLATPAGQAEVNKGYEQELQRPERLKALAESRMLDSPPDDAFDRLTRLASRLIMVPVSVASFIAADRQFYKSQKGMEGKWAERRGTPLSHAFCQWVVSSKQPLMVDDARRHRVLRSNAAVTDLGVVAYCGVPVVGAGGEAIGSMCAVDTHTRNWSDQDLETLQDLATVAQAYATRKPEMVAMGVQGATRVLRRYGVKLRDDERLELLQIIEEQTALLAKG